MLATHRAADWRRVCVVCGGLAGAGQPEGWPLGWKETRRPPQGTDEGSSEKGRTAWPVVAQNQKSLPPHSMGYKRMSSLQRF